MSTLQDMSTALTGVVAQAAPSIVSVRSHKSRSTGFVWRTGLVVTVDEALAEEGQVEIVDATGKVLPATIAGSDPGTDIALLRVEGLAAQAAPLSATVPEVGAMVVTLGAERGAPTAALGIVAVSSGPWRSMRGGDVDARIELDVRLRRACEGGLALDATGAAIGMAVFGPRRRVLVIPAATIERVASRLETHGRVPRGYLGLAMQPVALDGGGNGAMVIKVDQAGPGSAAGIHQGDIIVAWNGAPIGGVRALLTLLGSDTIGQAAGVDLLRGGQRHRIELRIGERPSA